jgi:uncharacterized protein YndB with AHSA1/START domain
VAAEHLVEASTTVAAPLAPVWRYLRRLDQYPEWIESSLELVRADPIAMVGAELVEHARVLGFFTATITWRVVDLEEEHRIVFEGSGVPTIGGLGFAVVLEPAEGSTEFTLTLWYTPKYGVLGSVIEFLAHGGVNADHKRSARTFAILAERASGSAGSEGP